MRKISTFIILTFICPILANAGVLYLEVPDDISVEIAQNPTPEQDEMIDNFILSELNRIDSEGADRVVVLTKDGDVIPQAETQTKGDDGFPFFIEGDLRPTNDNWGEDEWQSIEEHYAAAYPYAKQIFGGPVVAWYHPDYTRYIEITEFPDMENTWGAYVMKPDGTNAIWLQSWPGGEPSADRDYRRGHLIRNMLSAFRWLALCTWDQFGGGMRHAAWLEIVKAMANNGYLTQFNDTHHDSLLPDDPDYSRPYYASLEQYNTMEMATSLADFFSEKSAVSYKIKHARYGACGYVWWKLYNQGDSFIRSFNSSLTDAWNVHCDKFGPDDEYRPIYDDLYKLAAAAYEDSTGQPIHEFEGWFERQPILTDNVTYGHQLLLTADRNIARVICYERIDPYCEIADDPYEGTINVIKRNSYGNGALEEFAITLTGGIGEQEFNLRGSGEGFVFDTSVNIGINEFNRRDYVYGGLTNDRKKFYGVLPFENPDNPFGTRPAALSLGNMVVWDDEGHSHVLNDVYQLGGNGEIRWFDFNSDLWPGFDPLETEVIHSRFEPSHPGLFNFKDDEGTQHNGAFPLVQEYEFRRDSGEYGLYRAFVPQEEFITDGNENGIDDEAEKELMERFKPVVQMHLLNHLHPSRDETILHNGTVTLWHFNVVGGREIWSYERIDENNVEDIFDAYDFDWHFDPSYEFTLTFGRNQPDDTTTKTYWWGEWNYTQGKEGIYDNTAIYANVFRENGQTIIQYWFYYPFNDWGNNHEGDWEHINVVLSSSDPYNSGIVKALYYFHEHYGERSRDQIEIWDEQHPVVYVGGTYFWLPKGNNRNVPLNKYGVNSGDRSIGDRDRLSDSFNNTPEGEDGYGNCSGGSYWAPGTYENAGHAGADERVDGGGDLYYPYDIDLIYLHFEQNEDNFAPGEAPGDNFWRDLPGGWGRPGMYLHMNLAGDAPVSPYWHECFEIYKAPGYTGWHGTPKTMAGTATDESSSNSTPAFPFALHQTAPNPAKGGSVNFAFSVPETCEAKLTVYDIKGRIISIPFKEKIVPGEYSAELSTASLPAGVYLYRLEAGTDVAVKKMVITK